jgi:hypothetical protein
MVQGFPGLTTVRTRVGDIPITYNVTFWRVRTTIVAAATRRVVADYTKILIVVVC